MNIIEKKIKFNPQRVHLLIARQAGIDINGLSAPCYEVKTKVFEAKVYRELGVSQKDMKDFAVRSVKGTKGEKSKVVKVPFTFTLGYLYYKFIKANKQKMAGDILLYTLIKHYGSRYHVHLPTTCNPDLFRYTIKNMTSTQLFYREKTIANALIFLSKALGKRYYSKIKERDWDPELLSKFMVESRHRVAQSTRNFFRAYYRYSEDKKGISVAREPEDEDQRNLFQTTTASTGKTVAIEKFIKSMFVYKMYDRKAIDEAKRESRVKSNLAENIIPIIHEKSSQENIKIILTSFLKEILDTKSLCGDNFFKIIKKLMMVRNFKKSFVFRNLVVDFTGSILNSINPTINVMSQRDRISLDVFVAFYITTSFRNLFCIKS